MGLAPWYSKSMIPNDHPLAHKGNGVDTHRIVLFDKIGLVGPHCCHDCGIEIFWLWPKHHRQKLIVHHVDNDRRNNTPENLVPLCFRCNLSSKNRRPEWMHPYYPPQPESKDYKLIRAVGHPLQEGHKKVRILEHRYRLYEFIGAGPHPCHWCQKIVDWFSKDYETALVVDHVDGSRRNNELTNLVPSCLRCNVVRGNKTVVQDHETHIVLGMGSTRPKRLRAVSLICRNCGADYLREARRSECENGGFCSISCAKKSYWKELYGPHPTSVCVTCGKTYEFPRARIKGQRFRGEFCSRQCAGKNKFLPREDRPCIQCGTIFTVIPTKLAREGRPGKFCSHHCQGEFARGKSRTDFATSIVSR